LFVCLATQNALGSSTKNGGVRRYIDTYLRGPGLPMDLREGSSIEHRVFGLIEALEEKKREAVKQLIIRFLNTGGYMTYSLLNTKESQDQNSSGALRILRSIGIVVYDRKLEYFKLSASILLHILSEKYYPVVKAPVPLSDPVSHFDEFLSSAFEYCHHSALKHPDVQNVTTDTFSEYIVQGELFAILRSWLGTKTVLRESHPGSDPIALVDIHIVSGISWFVELAVGKYKKEDMQMKVDQTEQYGLGQAQKLVVLNFVCSNKRFENHDALIRPLTLHSSASFQFLTVQYSLEKRLADVYINGKFVKTYKFACC